MYEQDSKRVRVTLACGHTIEIVMTNMVTEQQIREEYEELICMFCEEKANVDQHRQGTVSDRIL